MKKCLDNKGYIMTEALIISGIVLAALILIYANFARINKNSNENYYFNNVNGIYALNQVATFLDEDGIDSMVSALNGYVDITNCTYATDTKYCKLLVDGANIKHLIFTYNDKYFIDSSLAKNNPYNLRMYDFVKTLDDSTENYGALLVAEFNDGYYAAIPYGYGLDIIPPKPPTSGAIGNVSGSNPTGTIQTPASGATDNSGTVVYKYLVTNDNTMPDKNNTNFTESLNFTRSCGTSYYGWAIAEDSHGNRSDVYNMGSTSDGANQYSDYGTCSKTCGGGTQTRTNACALVTTNLSQSCNTQSCCSYTANQIIANYGYTGGVQSFTVPAGCTGTYLLEVWGAQGGNMSIPFGGWPATPGGNGGKASGYAHLTAGTVLYVIVGGAGSANSHNGKIGYGGYNGGGTGGSSEGAGGGGATHIGTVNALLSGTPVANLLIAAGGGGGAGMGSQSSPEFMYGGAGGGTAGGDGYGSYPGSGGGTQSGGGAGYYSGGYGYGGSASYYYEGGGGGGGYYGGGAGGNHNGSLGGGGGSGYIGGVTSGSMSNGVQSGNGYARITFASY